MDIFNNRELATGIWSILFLVWCCTQPEIRTSFKDLAKAFWVKVIIVPLALMALYVLFIVFLINAFSLWNLVQLKNTILWFIFTAVVSFFNINSISQNPHYFRDTIKDNLKLLVILEFLVSFYTFDIWVELVLIPSVVFLALMLEMSKSDEKYQVVEKFINSLLVFFGILLIVYTIFKLVIDWGDFAKVQTLYDFYIPPLLTFLFLPFIYLMVLFIGYQSNFLKLNNLIDNSKILCYAKFKVITKFNVNIELMKRWVNSLYLKEKGVKTKNEIKLSIDKIYAMQAAEKNPEEIPISKGWSPYAAKDFLIQEGIETGYYHPSYSENEWIACSPYKELGNEILANKIAYYIDGDCSIAKNLKLVLNVNTKQSAIYAHQKLLDLAKSLYFKSLLSEMPSEIEYAILSGDDKIFQTKTKKVSVIKTNWKNSKDSGYSIKFIVEHI